MENNEKYIKIVIDNDTLDKYNDYYFKMYPKRHKAPIERPIHPSLNKWMIMKRPQMNDLKQKWKEFGIWLINDLGMQDMKLDTFKIKFTTFMPTRRRADPDNYSGKFILDSFTEAGLIVDDDGLHLLELSLSTNYDKNDPRTEIEIYY